LLYYINGDYQQRLEEHAEDVQRLWTAWLAARYSSLEQLHAAWATPAPAESFEAIPFPPPRTGRWDDLPALDAARFQTDLTTRWNDAHVQAVRGADPSHPITSEYYQRPSIGIDLRATIGTQDLSNIGYFDEPEVDLDRLPLQIALADLRARGKGVSLGEYGVKTHPAWSREQGALSYHIRRSEEQQQQLFMAVAHYGLGMGCAKVQNWCLRDAQAWVFPWGLFYPNQLVPKDVAYTHRNLSLLWSHLQPRYETPPVLVALAGNMRLGNDADVGAEIACRTYDDLLSLHLPFVSLDDASWGTIPDATRLVLCPSPFALSDEAFEQLYEWVRGGGTLLVTGDFAYDCDRGRTRLERH
jgi:hypothetical protein